MVSHGFEYLNSFLYIITPYAAESFLATGIFLTDYPKFLQKNLPKVKESVRLIVY